MKKLLLVLVIPLLMGAGCTVEDNKNEKTVIDNNLEYSCTADKDCVITAEREEYNNCCSNCNSVVINKEVFQNRMDWWEENCQEAICPLNDCYDEKMPVARCIDYNCEIEWQNR